MKRCENLGKAQNCGNSAASGHIYCKPCRLATGGYDRYNPHPAHGKREQTQYSSNKQE